MFDVLSIISAILPGEALLRRDAFGCVFWTTAIFSIVAASISLNDTASGRLVLGILKGEGFVCHFTLKHAFLDETLEGDIKFRHCEDRWHALSEGRSFST